MYLVNLPRKKVLSVPRNMKLLAVPLFELYDNANRYGSQLSAIPLYLSSYNFEFVDSDDKVIATYASDAWSSTGNTAGQSKSIDLIPGNSLDHTEDTIM